MTMLRFSVLGVELGLVLRLGLGIGFRLGLRFVMHSVAIKITKIRYDRCHNRSRRIKVSFMVKFRVCSRIK